MSRTYITGEICNLQLITLSAPKQGLLGNVSPLLWLFELNLDSDNRELPRRPNDEGNEDLAWRLMGGGGIQPLTKKYIDNQTSKAWQKTINIEYFEKNQVDNFG